MGRRLALIKKIDLSNLGEGWEGTFMRLNPPLTRDMARIAKATNGKKGEELDTEALSEQMISLVKDKFVDGEVLIENEDGSSEKAAMEAEDVDSLPLSAVSEAFTQLLGKDFDPKAGKSEVQSENKPTDEEATTEMPS